MLMVPAAASPEAVMLVQPGGIAVGSAEDPMSLSSSKVVPDADVPAAENRNATANAKPNCFITVSRHSGALVATGRQGL